MDHPRSKKEDEFAARLADLHQAVREDDPSVLPKLDDASTDPELRRAAGVLRLIERIRGQVPDTSRQSTTNTDPSDSTNSQNTPPQLPDRIGRFRVIRQLGAGGYGIVLLGFDPLLKRPVAIKLPRPEVLVTADLRERFMREAEAAAALNHPNVVPVYETGSHGPLCYIAAAYVHGESLAEWMQRQDRSVSFEQAARILCVLADAVGHAHQRGVVHRDLKPANVLIQVDAHDASLSYETDADIAQSIASTRGEVTGPIDPTSLMITDFGLAKLERDNVRRTQSGAVLGTPAYMSPEQAEGGQAAVGPETDIHALGVILYELLVGKAPFQEQGLWETLQAVRQREPKPPHRLRPGMPRDLEAICLKCLEKTPTRRYRTANDLGADLERFLAAEPVRARTVGRLERGIRWCGRNPLLAGLYATVVLLLSFLAIQAQLSALRLASEVERKNEAESTAHAMRIQAEAAREETKQQLYESLLAQARMTRQTHESGQRDAALSLLQRASEIRRQLDLGDDQRLKLRNELLATLDGLELQRSVDWRRESSSPYSLSYALDARLVAIPRTTQGDVLLRSIGSLEETRTIEDFKDLNVILGVDFSSDGSALASYYSRRREGMYFRVWDLERDRELLDAPLRNGSSAGRTLRLSSHLDHAAQRAALPLQDSAGRWTVNIVSLRQANETLARVQPSITPDLIRFHPNGKELAILGRDGIELWDFESNRRLDRLGRGRQRFREIPRDANWSADGSLLAVAAGDIYLWSQRNLAWLSSWSPPAGSSHTVHFSPQGDLLATSGNLGVATLWSPADGRLLWQGNGKPAGFSADGQRLAFTNNRGEVGHWRIVRSTSHWVLNHLQPAGNGTGGIHSVSPPKVLTNGSVREIITFDSGRLVACRVGNSVCWWDAQRRQLLRQWPKVGPITTDPSGRFLVAQTRNGLVIWSVSVRSDASQRTISSEPSRQVDLRGTAAGRDWKPVPGGGPGNVLLATVDRESPGLIASLDCQSGMLHIVVDDLEAANAWSWSSSSDGKLIAVTTRTPPGIRIYEDGADQPRNLQTAELPIVHFLPDSQKLLAVSPGKIEVFDALLGGTELTRALPILNRHRPQMAIDCSGRWLAVSETPHRVRLLAPSSLRELGRIDTSPADQILSLAFSTDGWNLFVGTQKGQLHVFDLGTVQLRAAEMDVAWPWQDVPQRSSTSLAIDLPEGSQFRPKVETNSSRRRP